ncbi:MAG: GMC oxidoreductase, partial [Chloroflexota bacterium]
KIDPDASAPELQFHFGPTWFIDHGFGNPEGDGMTMLPGIVGTKSIGSIKLNSANPTDAPMIDPNFLGDEHDVKVIVEGVKISRKILNSAAFDDYRGEEHLPGADVQTDEELTEFVRNYTQTIYHPVGTCKMGNDPMAVVNDRLQVHGVKGLRVADASIMPTIVNANTNNPSIMIGEKCADLILTGM